MLKTMIFKKKISYLVSIISYVYILLGLRAIVLWYISLQLLFTLLLAFIKIHIKINISVTRMFIMERPIWKM